MSAADQLYASPLFQQIAGGTWRPGGLALTRHALELCAFPPRSEILDIGCGQGASLALLRELGMNGTGLDNTCSLTEDFPFVRADAQDPPFPDASFDGILCECVLSLLPDAEQALRRFVSILRPKGKLLLSDLYLRQETTILPDKAWIGSSCLAGARTRQGLERLLQKSGFDLLHTEDHTACLKELAARLLWYGDASLKNLLHRKNDAAEALRGPAGSCACGAVRSGGLRYGYGLWIATPSSRSVCPDEDTFSGENLRT